MAQGATQFYRRTVFHELGGYDETVYMGEDVEFFWKAKRSVKRTPRFVTFIKEARVIPSPRRFDQWTLWESLVMNSPLFILIFRKTKSAWPGWYEKRPK